MSMPVFTVIVMFGGVIVGFVIATVAGLVAWKQAREFYDRRDERR